MRKGWSWLGLNLGKRAGVVGLVGLVVTIGLGVGIVKISFYTTNASYLNSNDPVLTTNNQYQRLFGGDPIELMFTMDKGQPVANLFTFDNEIKMIKLQDQIEKIPNVHDAITPLDLLELTQRIELYQPGQSIAYMNSHCGNVASSLGAQILLAGIDAPQSAASTAIKTKNLDFLAGATTKFTCNLNPANGPVLNQQVVWNPAWDDILLHDQTGQIRASDLALFPNNSHAVMGIYIKGGLSIDQEAAVYKEVVNDLHSYSFQNATTLATGVPALLAAINNYLRSGILILGGIGAVLMVIILLIFFSVRWRLLPFAIVAIGLIWAFGLVGYFGIPISLGSIASLPVLLGVGIDYAIQMHSRVEEEVVLDRADHPIQATARNLAPALLVVTFDAVFAFAAMWFAQVPMVRQFGWVLIVGIIAVCICSIIGPLAFLGIREYKSPTKGHDFSNSRLSRIVVFLGSLPKASAIPLAIAAVVVFGTGLAAEGHLTLQTDPLSWVNPHAQAIVQLEELKAGTGADNLMGVLIKSDDPWTNSWAKEITTFSDSEQSKYSNLLESPTGAVNTVSDLLEVPGSQVVDPTGLQVRQVYAFAPPSIQTEFVADNGTYVNLIYYAKSSSLSGLNPVVDNIDAYQAPAGLTIAPTGIAAVGLALVNNLAKSRTLLTYLAIIFVGLWLAVRMRSLVRSILSLVPVLIAVGATSLVALAINLKLSPMTSVAGPLVVAVCTEFTSLILLRFVEERNRGLDPRAAMDMTARRTGRAFMVSAMTAVAGTGVLAASSMPLVSGFGVVLALNVAVALLSALVILPPILVWAEEHGWVTKHGWFAKNAFGHFEDETPRVGHDALPGDPTGNGASSHEYGGFAPAGALSEFADLAGSPIEGVTVLAPPRHSVTESAPPPAPTAPVAPPPPPMTVPAPPPAPAIPAPPPAPAITPTITPPPPAITPTIMTPPPITPPSTWNPN